MNRAQLIDEVARVTGSKKEATLAVGVILTAIQRELKKGDDITLTGFGTFSISKKNASIGGNHQTGTLIEMPASAFLD